MKKKILVGSACLLMTACSSNDQVLNNIDDIKGAMDLANSEMQMTGSTSASKEENCQAIAQAYEHGLEAYHSSFSAMNQWFDAFKDPKIIALQKTPAAQLYVALGVTLMHCETLESDAGQLIANIKMINKQ